MQPRPIRALLIASAASVALAVGAAAGLAETTEAQPAPAATQKTPAATTAGEGAVAYRVRASEVIGKTVKNPQNQTLGSITDIVVGQGDKAVYAVLSVGGFLGIGDKLVAVRYDELKRDTKDVFVFNASKDELKALPAFEFQTADAGVTDANPDAYRKRMGAEVDEWKGKVDDYSTKAQEKGTTASRSAAQKLDRAWDNVKTHWNKLQSATDDTWDDTRAAFEKAWRDFQDSWKSATNT